jgi:hypothetical protein
MMLGQLRYCFQNRQDSIPSRRHVTFIARTLIGLGCSGLSRAFQQAMPMPAVYRL